MFYIAIFQYIPNTAATNRIMAYVRALSELKVKSCLVSFLPDKTHSKVEINYPYVIYRYYWDKFLIDLPRLNKLSLRLYFRQFVRSLQPGDKVLVYGLPDLVIALSKRTDISVFAETTEHPEVYFGAFLRKTTISLYLKACSVIKGMIVISEGLRRYFIENGCSPDRTHVVNMIVDIARFQDLKKQSTDPYIAYCGTASNNKDGVDQLIKAFALVANRHLEYKLYIIGNTPSKKQRFENLELTKSLGIEDKVIFTGLVPSSKMPQLLKNASILALDRPDNIQAKYGFPTKLGEYLLTANPVVITSVGDIPLFLVDGVSALISEPQNPQSFANKLCWAIENPIEAQMIGELGKRVAEEKFNYLTETKKIINLINA